MHLYTIVMELITVVKILFRGVNRKLPNKVCNVSGMGSCHCLPQVKAPGLSSSQLCLPVGLQAPACPGNHRPQGLFVRVCIASEGINNLSSSFTT